MHPGQTTGSETHAAFGRRSIPAEPRRFAPLIVAFRSEYTRYSSLTRLVNRAPRRPRRSRGFHHRLFTASLRAAHRCVSVGIHPGQFSRWGLLPHAPCQPGASPLSALTRVPPPAVKRRRYFPVRQRPEVRLDGRHSRQRAVDSFPGHVLFDVAMRPTPSQHGTLSLLEAVSGRTIRDCERVRHSRRRSAASSALVSRSRAMPTRGLAFQAVPALFRARDYALSPACAPSDLISRTHSRPPSAGCADQEVGVPWPLRHHTYCRTRKNKWQRTLFAARETGGKV